MKISPFVQACFLMLGLSLPVAAITSNWNTNLGGSFIDATKWSAGVPLVNDTAVFNRNLDIEYAVTFPGRPILSPLTREVRQLIVGTNTVSFSDSVNFNQLPANFAIDAANTLAEGALVIGTAGTQGELNTSLSNFSTSSVIIGNTSVGLNNGGVLNVNGGTFNVTGSQELGDELIIGEDGNGGSLNVTSGANVNVTGGTHANMVMGRGGTNNYATVSSAGSALTISGSLSIGEQNFSNLTIQNGGQLTSGNAVMGKSSFFATGTVNIEDAGSTWTNNGEIIIGKLGVGQLFVSDGGQILTSGSAYLGELSGSVGQARVVGAGSSWTIGGNLLVGRTGTGSASQLRVITGGSIAVAGTLTVASTGIIESNSNISADITNSGIVDPGSEASVTEGALQLDGSYTQTAAGKLKFDIGGTIPATNYDQLLVSGAVSLNGTLQVLLSSPFIPAVGDAFNIIDGAGISGTFNTLQLPSLPSGISWNATQLYTTGRLLVTIAGDFDADGDVDGRDFLLWQRGGSLNPFSASDLADWQANYGMGGLIAASTAVPEPNALIVMIPWFGVAVCRLFRRSGKSSTSVFDKLL